MVRSFNRSMEGLTCKNLRYLHIFIETPYCEILNVLFKYYDLLPNRLARLEGKKYQGESHVSLTCSADSVMKE